MNSLENVHLGRYAMRWANLAGALFFIASIVVSGCASSPAGRPAASLSAAAASPLAPTAEDLYNQALVHFDQHNYELALADCDESLRRAPNSVSALNLRGAIRLQQKYFDEAASIETSVIALDPGMAEAYHNRAMAYLKGGKAEVGPDAVGRALSDLDQALTLNPKLAPALVSRGVVYLRSGQNEKAIQDETSAIELDPNNADAFYNRGYANANEGHNAEALADWKQTLQLNPAYTDVLVIRGSLYARSLSQFDQAIADETTVIAKRPNEVDAYYIRGLSFVMTTHYQEALADFSKCIEIAPTTSIYREKRGYAYLALGDYTKATSDEAEALRLNPKNADAYTTMGAIDIKLGKFDQAFEQFDRALAIQPDLANAANGRAWLLRTGKLPHSN